MNIRRAQPSETEEIRQWIGSQHYLGDTPPGCVIALEFFERDFLKVGRLGAMLLGRPCARGFNGSGYEVHQLLELTRAFFVDDTAHSIESQALGMMRKHIRTWFQQVRLLIAYSDPERGHKGTIYAADGWAPFGMTSHRNGSGWKSRNGRAQTQAWQKQRWVRTP